MYFDSSNRIASIHKKTIVLYYHFIKQFLRTPSKQRLTRGYALNLYITTCNHAYNHSSHTE